MSTKTLTVFDPSMCCSTGVCGPDVDQELVRFSADLEWLGARGVHVERFNLAQEPGAFAEDSDVKQLLESDGEQALPLFKIDDEVVTNGEYPSRDVLGEWMDIEAPESIFTEAVGELVAIGAAIASNCEPCFKFHYDKARKAGVSREDMLQAVELAQNVKETPARHVHDVAMKFLEPQGDEDAGASEDTKSGCSGPNDTDETDEQSSSSGRDSRDKGTLGRAAGASGRPDWLVIISVVGPFLESPPGFTPKLGSQGGNNIADRASQLVRCSRGLW